jgi:hypothetical protein
MTTYNDPAMNMLRINQTKYLIKLRHNALTGNELRFLAFFNLKRFFGPFYSSCGGRIFEIV